MATLFSIPNYLYSSLYSKFALLPTPARAIKQGRSVIEGQFWNWLNALKTKTLWALLDVTCPVCLHECVLPKMLSRCGHTICELCEERLTPDIRYNRSLTCPICRVVTQLPRGERLPTNWLVKQLLEEKPPNSNVCSSCSTGIPRNQVFTCDRCSETEDLICGYCALTHHSSHISEVKPIEYVSSSIVRDEIAKAKTKIDSEREQKWTRKALNAVIKNIATLEEKANVLIEKISKTQNLTRRGLQTYLVELKKITDEIENAKNAIERCAETCGF